MFMPQDNKQTQAVMFDPMKEREAMRKRKMAEMLMQQGNQPDRNEMAGGMTVKRSPWEDINKAAQKFYGQYQLEQADAKDAEIEKARQQRVAEALSQWGTNPQGAAEILGQDPRTQEMAMRLMQGELDYSRQKERWAQQDALQREMIQARAAGGGNTPAAMQIASRMFELEQAMNNPNVPDAERFLAQREYNLLGQAAKTYAFDRGTEMMPDMSGYQGVYGQPPQMPQPLQMQQPQQQGAIDPIQQHAMAVQQQQAQTGVSPMQRPELANQQIYNTPQIREIEGYGKLMADRAAQKKMAEERAKTLASPMPANIVLEQNEIVEKARIADGIQRDMDKFINQIDSGSLNLDVIGNLQNKLRNGLSMSTEESRNLSSFQSSLEKLRNDSLRLNNGVQTDGDATRAWNELVQNINDPKVVRQRLQEIKLINQRGEALQKQKLNIMRAEYGRGELKIPEITKENSQNISNQQGQIAVNPQTGERMINRGNGWEPLQ